MAEWTYSGGVPFPRGMINNSCESNIRCAPFSFHLAGNIVSVPFLVVYCPQPRQSFPKHVCARYKGLQQSVRMGSLRQHCFHCLPFQDRKEGSAIQFFVLGFPLCPYRVPRPFIRQLGPQLSRASKLDVMLASRRWPLSNFQSLRGLAIRRPSSFPPSPANCSLGIGCRNN